MSKKITKSENFEKIIEVLKAQGKDELVKVMEHEKELLEKKRNNGKMTATQKANEGIKETIIEILKNATEPMSVTEITKANKDFEGFSNQKMSALVTQLVKSKELVRTQNGKKAVFSLAEEN